MSGVVNIEPLESEADFSTWFEDCLRLHGWIFFHAQTAWKRGRFMTARTGDSGFPDYVCVKPGRLLFVELKAQRGRLTAHQRVWAHTLLAAGADWNCWHPSDRDLILAVLSGGV